MGILASSVITSCIETTFGFSVCSSTSTKNTRLKQLLRNGRGSKAYCIRFDTPHFRPKLRLLKKIARPRTQLFASVFCSTLQSSPSQHPTTSTVGNGLAKLGKDCMNFKWCSSYLASSALNRFIVCSFCNKQSNSVPKFHSTIRLEIPFSVTCKALWLLILDHTALYACLSPNCGINVSLRLLPENFL